MANGFIEFLRGPKSTLHLFKGANTTVAAYWLNAKAYICYTWIIALIAMSLYFITRYEEPNGTRSINGEEEEEDDGYAPSLKKIHPIWLMVYRIFSFFVLLTIMIVNAIANGGSIFYFYTEWTFTLLIIYFWFGSLLSMYVCYHHHIGPGDRRNPRQVAWFWGYIFQIIFQVVAGAVVLTDCTFWFIIIPYLSINKQNDFHILPIAMHSINVVFLLCDAALNSMRFPFFRIGYFILWTCAFVIFHWILHACVAVGWPYPFLDLSNALSPLWYLLVALMHFPCYGIWCLLIKLKHFLLMKWFRN